MCLKVFARYLEFLGKNKFNFFFLLSFFHGSACALAQSDSIPNMKFGNLNLGLDLRKSNGNYFNPNRNNSLGLYATRLYGLSVQFQNSFIANYIAPKQRRFIATDILGAEGGIGFFSSNNPDIKGVVGVYYRFDFGLATIYRINRNNDLGLNLILLTFSRDRVSPNISGSLVQVRYRYKRIIVEAGIEARRDRIFGWLQALQPNFEIPLQYHLHSTLLQSNMRTTGLRLEYMGTHSSQYLQNNLNPLSTLSIRVYHGIYF